MSYEDSVVSLVDSFDIKTAEPSSIHQCLESRVNKLTMAQNGGSNEHSNMQQRLEKLVRTYDSVTMKLFIAMECTNEVCMRAHYAPEKRERWEPFLKKAEACRLDLTRHSGLREDYEQFFIETSRESQAKEFHLAARCLFNTKGALDLSSATSVKHCQTQINDTFCDRLMRMFERKLDAWIETCDAVAVRLTGHVKVSGFVRVLHGEVPALCRRQDATHVLDFLVTEAETPRLMDVAHLCLLKMLVIQNGLEDPSNIHLGLLALHTRADRPLLRLWEYVPSGEMEKALREADIDKVIDAGKNSEFREMSLDNVYLSGEESNEHCL